MSRLCTLLGLSDGFERGWVGAEAVAQIVARKGGEERDAGRARVLVLVSDKNITF